VFNATFDNISVIACQSVLLDEEIRVPSENHKPFVLFLLAIVLSVLLRFTASVYPFGIFNDKVCQRLATGRWFSLGTSVSPINKTDHTIQLKYCWKWR